MTQKCLHSARVLIRGDIAFTNSDEEEEKKASTDLAGSLLSSSSDIKKGQNGESDKHRNKHHSSIFLIQDEEFNSLNSFNQYESQSISHINYRSLPPVRPPRNKHKKRPQSLESDFKDRKLTTNLPLTYSNDANSIVIKVKHHPRVQSLTCKTNQDDSIKNETFNSRVFHTGEMPYQSDWNYQSSNRTFRAESAPPSMSRETSDHCSYFETVKTRNTSIVSFSLPPIKPGDSTGPKNIEMKTKSLVYISGNQARESIEDSSYENSRKSAQVDKTQQYPEFHKPPKVPKRRRSVESHKPLQGSKNTSQPNLIFKYKETEHRYPHENPSCNVIQRIDRQDISYEDRNEIPGVFKTKIHTGNQNNFHRFGNPGEEELQSLPYFVNVITLGECNPKPDDRNEKKLPPHPEKVATIREKGTPMNNGHVNELHINVSKRKDKNKIEKDSPVHQTTKKTKRKKNKRSRKTFLYLQMIRRHLSKHPFKKRIWQSLEFGFVSHTSNQNWHKIRQEFRNVNPKRRNNNGKVELSSLAVSNGSTKLDSENMAVLHLAAEGRDYLMWCPDSEFDKAVSSLDMRGLVDLVQTLQDAMAVEQQTFESLSVQLEQAQDPILQQRLSAALCTSQSRLARLCSRNMRCFAQQALKSKQKDGHHTSSLVSYGSRSPSPRDSGLAVSSTGGSDLENDLKEIPSSPASVVPPSAFKNSLNFFQKAANLVSPTARQAKGCRNYKSRGTSSGAQKGNYLQYQTKSSPAADHQLESCLWSTDLRENSGDLLGGAGGGGSIREDNRIFGSLEDEFEKLEDPETYEQVLFINGKPLYTEEVAQRSHSYDPLLEMRSQLRPQNTTNILVHAERKSRNRKSCPTTERSRSCSWSRGQFSGSGTSAVVLEDPSPCVGGTLAAPVLSELHSRSLRSADPSHSHSLTDISSCVSLPKRKPVLNFGSVSSDENARNLSYLHKSSEYLLDHSSGCLPAVQKSDFKTVSRAHSFKEGLDSLICDPIRNCSNNLSRTRSCHDGLAKDFNEPESSNPKLRRVPSVDEILESVKTLRAKKTMVKSEPDLKDKNGGGSNSGSRHKGSKNKTKGSSGSSHKKRIPETTYIHEYETVDQRPYYENLSTHAKEVIYDKPKNPERYHERVSEEQYENVPGDQPLYENILENEPTYMNITNKSKKTNSSKKSKSSKNKSHSPPENTYANIEEAGYTKASLARVISDHQTYDVPRSATHIYDIPPNQPRKVKHQHHENEYDTPRNNRMVNPNPNNSVHQKAKKQQIKKIDDIFADCEKDSLDGDTEKRHEPDIPSPDYGSEDEETSVRIPQDLLSTTKEHKSTSTNPPEYIDEGLGESDSRSYYADEQGLEVILEEPEEDYCSSHTSEEDIRREVGLRLSLKGERRSLDGSEGIGSAEGDSQSSGSDGGEEDCASSGIHSEDTPSPGPPRDITKEKQVLSGPPDSDKQKKDEDRTQKDRCIEIYPETIRQRQRNMAPSPTKVDIRNFEGSSEAADELSRGKKFLPSVKALRHQFENGKVSPTSNGTSPPLSQSPPTLGRNSSNSSNSSLNNLPSIDTSSGFNSLTSSHTTTDASSTCAVKDEDESVEPIFSQFKQVDRELKELMSKPPISSTWDAIPLLKKLYYVPEAPKMHSKGTNFINIEGYLEKLPSGRKKATFWNAWKRRYFAAKDGILYYYQSNQADKASMKLSLMGGKIEIMEHNNMINVDDGKGHYVVVRCSSKQEAERWKHALESHTVDDFSRHFVQPWPRPTNPTLLRDTLIIDLGSCSVRAGVLASQATLPQVFFPSVLATNRETKRQIWGFEALSSEIRSTSSVSFPIRPSHKISKYSVDLTAVSSLIQKAFTDLKVDPKNYNIQLSVPRVLNPHTQSELLRIMFEKFGVKSVNLTHQSILALYAYNATSGIVVDIGERLDVVPVIDGYIVDGGVSRVPYGGYRIMEHLRQFLFQKNVSLVNEVESYLLRSVLESICYCAQHYNTEKARCTNEPQMFEKSIPFSEYHLAGENCEAFRNISLDFGRFQATEGIFNPDAWGLDHPGLHKLVHKAIQECSMDIRKEMSRSIFLAGGVSQLSGLSDRLSTELDNLTPTAIHPKVHASPYRYHAAYLGACVLAESPAFAQSKIDREEWIKQGNSALRKWAL